MRLAVSKHSLVLSIVSGVFGLLDLAWANWIPGVVLLVITVVQLAGSWWVHDPSDPQPGPVNVPLGTKALAFTGMVGVGLIIAVYGVATLLTGPGSQSRILATAQLVVVYAAWLGARLVIPRLLDREQG